jgi:hypothetical protein
MTKLHSGLSVSTRLAFALFYSARPTIFNASWDNAADEKYWRSLEGARAPDKFLAWSQVNASEVVDEWSPHKMKRVVR